MKQTIRAFAVGLFTAAGIMLVVNYFTDGNNQDLSEMPVEVVVEELKNQGYRVLTEEDYISLSMKGEISKNETEIASSMEESKDNKENEEKENDSNEKEQDSSNEENSEDVKSYKLTVESGMPTSAISRELEENGIIEDANDFISYLEDEGYAHRIQLGTFTLSSDMSYEELAKQLTK